MQALGDAKAGTFVGSDRMGNKFYEDFNEIPGRHRWVEYYQNNDVNASQVEPAWHGWLHHIQKEPPNINPRMQDRPVWEAVSPAEEPSFFCSGQEGEESEGRSQWKHDEAALS